MGGGAGRGHGRWARGGVPDAAEWSPLPPLPDAHGVAGAFAGVAGGALLVAGGANFPDGPPWQGGTKAWTDRIWVLDRPDGAWREAGRLTGPRVSLGAVPSHPGFDVPVLGYHTITDTWTPLGPMPSVRVTTPAVAWRGGFVIPSGETRPGKRSPQVDGGRLVPRRTGFGALNYAALTVHLAAIVLVGVSFTRHNRATDDFFRGGQRIPWWAAGLSIFATMLSSITFMAIPARGFVEGWNLFLANAYLVLTPLVTLVYLPFYRSLDVTSAYEYLERRFNAATRMLASALFLLFQCGRVAIVLYLPALALATVSSLDVTTSIMLMGVLCVVYTMLGGIDGVIWTDVAQTIVLLGGSIWALATLLARIDGGVAGAVAAAAAHGRFFQSVPWTFELAAASGWIIMLGGIFQNLFSYTASQDVVQRYLTTADRTSTARAVWTNAAVSPFAQALFFAIGTALFVFYRQHPERLDPTMQNDAVFPLFIVRELPAGVAGLIAAAIFAAAQSSLSSSLNSMATAYVTDFDRRFRPRATDASRLRLARGFTAAVGLTGTAVALALAKSDIRSL